MQGQAQREATFQQGPGVVRAAGLDVPSGLDTRRAGQVAVQAGIRYQHAGRDGYVFDLLPQGGRLPEERQVLAEHVGRIAPQVRFAPRGPERLQGPGVGRRVADFDGQGLRAVRRAGLHHLDPRRHLDELAGQQVLEARVVRLRGPGLLEFALERGQPVRVVAAQLAVSGGQDGNVMVQVDRVVRVRLPQGAPAGRFRAPRCVSVQDQALRGREPGRPATGQAEQPSVERPQTGWTEYVQLGDV